MNVCMHECLYVYLFVCMYVWMYVIILLINVCKDKSDFCNQIFRDNLYYWISSFSSIRVHCMATAKYFMKPPTCSCI